MSIAEQYIEGASHISMEQLPPQDRKRDLEALMSSERGVHTFLGFSDGKQLGVVYDKGSKRSLATLPMHSFLPELNPGLPIRDLMNMKIRDAYGNFEPKPGKAVDIIDIPTKSGVTHFYYFIVPVDDIHASPNRIQGRDFMYINIDQIEPATPISGHVRRMVDFLL